MSNVVHLNAACAACSAGTVVTGAGGVAFAVAILRFGETIEHLYGRLCPKHRAMVDATVADLAAYRH